MTASETELEELADTYCVSPHLMRPREIRAAASRGQPFLVDGAIPMGVTFIAGVPGAKKSWLAYSLALATCRGESWLSFQPGAQGPVLVLNYDNPRDLLCRRFVQLGMLDNDPLFVHSNARDPFKLPARHDHVLAVARRVRPKLIIVDSFRQSHTKNENDSEDMAEIMDLYKQLASDAAVVILHHAAKSGSPLRGSEEIHGSADALIVVSQELRKRGEAPTDVASWEKHRGWDPEAPIKFAFEVKDRHEGEARMTSVRRINA